MRKLLKADERSSVFSRSFNIIEGNARGLTEAKLQELNIEWVADKLNL